MDDAQFQILQPMVMAALRLSTLSLLVQRRAGSLPEPEREQAAQTLESLQEQLSALGRTLGTEPAELANIRLLAEVFRLPQP